MLAIVLTVAMMLAVFASCNQPGAAGPKGDKGEQGEQGEQGISGNGVISISKTSTNGAVDTYTVTFTDGTTTTFEVTNGVDGEQGIQGIQGVPGADGHTPIFTIQNGYWYIDGINTNQPAVGFTGETGNGISDISKTATAGLVDIYTITYTNGDTSTFSVTNGAQGVRGEKGEQGIQGIQGAPGIDGTAPVITIQNGNWYIDGKDSGKSATGLKGDTGNGVSGIAKTASSGLIDIYTITYTNGDTTTFTVTNGAPGEQGEQGAQGLQGIQGAKGEDGKTPTITIQNGYWYVDGVNTTQPATGVKGDTGNGISNIAKTSTEGLVDTYTITFTNGNTTTFTVTNGAQGIQGLQGEKGADGKTPVITIQGGYWYIDGVNTNYPATGIEGSAANGIANIAKTGTIGLVDTYTITFTNGSTTTFTVTNGAQGEQGLQGIQGVPGTNGKTPVITIQNGNWYIDGVDSGKSAAGVKGDTGNGISGIAKTGTVGLVDTYTITFTNGTTTTFTVTNGAQGEQGEQGAQGIQGIQGIQGVPGNDGHTPIITIQDGYWYIDGVNTNKPATGVKGDTGNGISGIAKTSTSGLVDTYTITFTNGTKTTFTVTNGAQGEQGIQGEKGQDGHTPVITIQNGYWYVDGVNTGVKATSSASGSSSSSSYLMITDYAQPNTGADVADAIQRAIDENPNRTIFFPDGEYLISKPIVTNSLTTLTVSFKLSNYAIIKAANNWSGGDNAMIRLGGGERKLNSVAQNGDQYFFEGGIVDGNSRAHIGISLEHGRETRIENVAIKRATIGLYIAPGANGPTFDNTGKQIGGSSDADITNLNITCTDTMDSIGILCDAYDNTFSYIRIGKAYIGVQLNGGGNFLRNIHPLISNMNIYTGSIAFLNTSGRNWYDTCYGDQHQIAFYVKNDSACIFTNCYGYWWKEDSKNQTGFVFEGKFNSIIENTAMDFTNAIGAAYMKVGQAGGTGRVINPLPNDKNRNNTYLDYTYEFVAQGQ